MTDALSGAEEAAYMAGLDEYPSPEEVAEQNTGYSSTAAEQQAWERGRQTT